VQALADAAAAVMSGAAGSTAPNQAQLAALGITGVTPANLAAVQAAIAATTDNGTGVDTLSELQTVVTNAVNAAATTTAALDTLGPAFVWRTPVYVDGSVRDGVLHGNVYVRGSGDPRFVVERLWLLMRRIQGLGIQKIQGDIVLDRSAFDVRATQPAL